MAMKNKSEIFDELRKKNGLSNIKAPGYVDFSADGNVLSIKIDKPEKNMQDDNNCFEGWALAIKANSEMFHKVVLAFDDTELREKDRLHCNRFLWRVAKFKEMFDWFEVEPNSMRYVNELMDNFKSIAHFINCPKNERDSEGNKPSGSEDHIERLFSNNEKYKKVLLEKIACHTIWRQFPCGIFRERVSRNTSVFTGGKSAIDLVATNNDKREIHVIELKAGKNKKVGILSEFLFYYYVLQSVFIDKQISYEDSCQNAFFSPNDGWGKIIGHLLVEEIHPLVNQKTLKLLENGLKTTVDVIKYEYDSEKIGVTLRK